MSPRCLGAKSRPRLGTMSRPSATQEGAYDGESLKDIKKASRIGRYDRCAAVHDFDRFFSSP